MRRGSSSRWNASFDEMTCSMPGIGVPWLGAPPVAIRMVFALTVSPVISRTVWASSITARVLTILAPDFSTLVV